MINLLYLTERGVSLLWLTSVACVWSVMLNESDIPALNVASTTGFHPRSDEELLPDSFPVGGTDRCQAGGSVAVGRWEGSPALHAVSHITTTK